MIEDKKEKQSGEKELEDKEESQIVKEEVKLEDKDNKIRISFIRGISQKNPYFYRVIIGSSPERTFLADEPKRIGIISRIHVMEPSTSQNINRFIKSFKKHNMYGLTYAAMSENLSQIEPVLKSIITKHELLIRNAWEIGLNDFDSIGITLDDDIIIPKNQKDAPVLKLLKNLKETDR